MAPSQAPSDRPEPAIEDEEDLTSRSDARRANREVEQALARLASDLVELPSGWLQKLELPEATLDTVMDARAIQSPPARNRQLRLVRSALRDENWPLVRSRVDALKKHGALPARLAPSSSAADTRAPEWTARLVGEGRAGIEAFLAIAPHADRTHLRNLVQNVVKARAERRQRAEERLTAAISSLLR